jgi:hypothetical protein
MKGTHTGTTAGSKAKVVLGAIFQVSGETKRTVTRGSTRAVSVPQSTCTARTPSDDWSGIPKARSV